MSVNMRPRSGQTPAQPTLRLALVLFLALLPLNSQVIGSPIVSTGKPLSAGLLLVTLLHWTIYVFPIGREARTEFVVRNQMLPSQPVWLALTAYATLLLVSTLVNKGEARDLNEYLMFPLSLIVFYVSERTERGSFFKALVTASCIHLVVAILLNQRTIDETSGAMRLGGGAHPITLGIESGLILLFVISKMISGTLDVLLAITLFSISLYTLFASFSKTAIIGTACGLLFLIATHKRAGSRARTVGFASMAGLVIYLGGPTIASALVGGRSTEAFVTGTGRLNIWQDIWNFFPDYYLFGYGWAPLHRAGGASAALYNRTGGLGAENSFVASLLMGGIGAFLLFLIIWTAMFKAAIRMSAETSGFSGGALTVLTGAAMLVDSLAGLNYLWWWVLGIFSLYNAYSARHTTTGSTADKQFAAEAKFAQ